MRPSEHLRILLGDYPNAIRMRGLGFAASVPPSYTAGSGRPVVLIPGVYERWHFLRPLAEGLVARGHPVHVIPELGINTRAIPASARRVLAALAARNLSVVALVAHSKGGLIATPFSGSRMAHLTPVPALRIFRPTHPVIRRLLAEQAVNARITSIQPAFDPHIPEGGDVVGGTNIRLEVIGHFRVLEDSDALAAVIAAVGRPEVAASTHHTTGG